jgi:Fe-S-cluster containining protein
MPLPIDLRLTLGPDGAGLSYRCPDGAPRVALAELLPALRELTGQLVDAAVEREAGAGRSVSCKAGCGACCRQLVPLTATEAAQLPSLIAGLDDAHRRRVLARFEDARAKLVAGGLWERLEGRDDLSRDQRHRLSTQYFLQDVACPFLEEESCSIHPQRPLVCRQYLVSSPAIHCRHPGPRTLVKVKLAADVHQAMTRIEARDPARPRFTALVRAPYLAAGDETGPTRTVPDWIERLLGEIRRSNDEQAAPGAIDS